MPCLRSNSSLAYIDFNNLLRLSGAYSFTKMSMKICYSKLLLTRKVIAIRISDFLIFESFEDDKILLLKHQVFDHYFLCNIKTTVTIWINKHKVTCDKIGALTTSNNVNKFKQ